MIKVYIKTTLGELQEVPSPVKVFKPTLDKIICKALRRKNAESRTIPRSYNAD